MDNKYRDVASFFSINQSRFPSYVIGTVISSMEKLPNDMIMIFANSFHFKNPFLMLVLSILLGMFGID
ncbi:MAG: hypothetical protein IKP67_02475, partial [Spirochaetales bacterium]|nr:hypothetical protein [Spirochaetales bacterium]